MSDIVGNPEDRFSHHVAQIIVWFHLALLAQGINVKHFYSGVMQVQDPSGMDLLKLTCKQKRN